MPVITRPRGWRRFGAILAVVCLPGFAAPASAQSPTPAFEDITYVLPQYLGYRSASEEEFARQVSMLRTRIGEGPYVKVGFSVYVWLSFDDWSVHVDDPAAVRAALSSTIADIDSVIARARAHRIPICLSILNAIRSAYDPVQLAAERADRRNMQWYADNTMANGWMTYSRYARRFRRVEEAYLREVGRLIAARMQQYPETLVAAAGDGEEELSNAKTPIDDPSYDLDSMLLADYSPLAIAEFRDWLRHGGLYAPGASYDGQGYELGARYAGDAAPDADTNGDGHTLDGDFGTQFTTWDLRYFDWPVADEAGTAIASAEYERPDWNPLVESRAGGFDAPRTWNRGDPWWRAWQRFRETMLWRHNVEFAKWITSSADAETGATVPPARWFSYQIPADYLFGSSPENPNLRIDTSASAWWTADIAPYGGIGITAFNGYLGAGRFGRTLSNVAPHIAERNRRWGLLEWHPSVPPAPADSPIWNDEMAVIERYRPAVIAPFAIDQDRKYTVVYDTGFEPSLKALVDRIKNGSASDAWMDLDTPAAGATVRQPFALAGWALDLGTIRGPGRGAGVERIEIFATRSGSAASVLLGTAALDRPRPDVASVFGAQFGSAGFWFVVRGLSPGVYDLEIRAHSRGVSTAAVNERHLHLTILNDPLMAINTPGDRETVPERFLVAGWALDRAAATGSGIDAIHVYAFPDEGPAVFLGVARLGVPRSDVANVFGAPFRDSGYELMVSGLPHGHYRIVVFARSAVSQTFDDARVASVTVRSGALMGLDAPLDGAVLTGPFFVSGWALEIASADDPGVDAVHVWAWPMDGSAPVFLGVATLGGPRADVADAFGPQYLWAGYYLPVTAPPGAGDYAVAIYAHSTITHTFNNASVVRVTIR